MTIKKIDIAEEDMPVVRGWALFCATISTAGSKDVISRDGLVTRAKRFEQYILEGE